MEFNRLLHRLTLGGLVVQPSPGRRPPHPRRPGGAALTREAAEADRTAVVLKGPIHLRPGPRPTTSPLPPVRQAARPQLSVHH